MKKVLLGRSELTVNSIGLELSPLLSLSFEESKQRMAKAMDAGIDLYDIGLPEEELQKRIGHAIAGRRSSLVLAGSFSPCEPKQFKRQLELLLRGLKTDYLDLCQIHDPNYLPRRGDSEGFYDALTDAKQAGYIRSIGLTTGTDDIALHALEYGWYDVLQYPWSSQSEEEDKDFIEFAHEAAMGTLAAPPEDLPDTREALEQELAWHDAFDQHACLWLAKEAVVERLTQS